MDILEKKEYYSILFDFYESLFTEKQCTYFKEYYFYDNTLSEIAKNYNISRAAVFDILNKVHNSLDDYENKLRLYEKYRKRNEIYEQINNDSDKKVILSLLEKLKEIE